MLCGKIRLAQFLCLGQLQLPALPVETGHFLADRDRDRHTQPGPALAAHRTPRTAGNLATKA